MKNTKQLMKAANIKPAELAAILGVARQTVSLWRNPDSKHPPSSIAATAIRLLVLMSAHDPEVMEHIKSSPHEYLEKTANDLVDISQK